MRIYLDGEHFETAKRIRDLEAAAVAIAKEEAADGNPHVSESEIIDLIETHGEFTGVSGDWTVR